MKDHIGRSIVKAETEIFTIAMYIFIMGGLSLGGGHKGNWGIIITHAGTLWRLVLLVLILVGGYC